MLPIFIALLGVVGGTVALLLTNLRRLRRSRRFGMVVSYCALMLMALAVGIQFGVIEEYRLNERMRVRGLPIPLVVFVFEEGNWTDFVKPRCVGFLVMLADAIFPAALAGLLWLFLPRETERSRKTGGGDLGSTNSQFRSREIGGRDKTASGEATRPRPDGPIHRLYFDRERRITGHESERAALAD